MAAETLSATRSATTFPVFKASGAGILCAAYGHYDIAAAVEDGDIFEMCRVPAGAVVLGGYLMTDDLDTGTEVLDMMVGWAANDDEIADPNGFALADVYTGDAAENWGNTGNMKFLGGVLSTVGPKTFTAETLIQVEVNTPANSWANGPMYLVVHYINP